MDITDRQTTQNYDSRGLMWSWGVRSRWLSIEGLLWSVSILCLFFAAILLRPVATGFAVVWLVTTAIVIPLHFYRAWRRLPTVPNRSEYAAWVLFETMIVAATVALFLYFAAES